MAGALRRVGFGVAAWALLTNTALAASDQSPKTIWSGVFTQEQATRGHNQYLLHCSRCHVADLTGTWEIPSLTARLMRHWAGSDLGSLVDYLNRAMPMDKPGSLDRKTDFEILAFILQSNDVPAGPSALEAADLSNVKITAAPRR